MKQKGVDKLYTNRRRMWNQNSLSFGEIRNNVLDNAYM